MALCFLFRNKYCSKSWAITFDTEQYIYSKDVQGNIIAILDTNGQTVVKYSYDAWGNCETVVLDASYNTLAQLNPFRYRSYYFDTETNLYFLQTRYYDPETGRFLSQDDVSYLDPERINGLNLYAYCGNNPVMGYDPDGTWDWGAFFRVLAAIAIVVTISAVVALTAGVAAIAIAGYMGATAIVAVAAGLTVGATALVSGLVVGTGEIIAQSIDKGINKINLGSIAISTLGGAVDGALIAGALFTGLIGKTVLIAGRVAVSIITTALYGVSEGYDGKTIGIRIARNAIITLAAGLITYLPVGNIATAVLAKAVTTGLIKAFIQVIKIIIKLIERSIKKGE